jgi:hypothetical protein
MSRYGRAYLDRHRADICTYRRTCALVVGYVRWAAIVLAGRHSRSGRVTSSGRAGEQCSAGYCGADLGRGGPRVHPADRFGAVPDLPWTARAEMEPGTGYLVMASHLPLQRITATVRFFRAVSAVRRQLATAQSLIGYTLRAKPLARDYWTLSVWTDDAALRAFMRTSPHVQVMTSLKPLMGPTKFVTWTATAADGRPSMAAALEYLAAG